MAYPLDLRHLHPERGRWTTLWAAESERATFRLVAPRAWPVRTAWQAVEPTSVIFRLGAWLASLVWVLLKMAVFLRLAATPARSALVLRQTAVTLHSERPGDDMIAKMMHAAVRTVHVKISPYTVQRSISSRSFLLSTFPLWLYRYLFD